MSPDDCIKLPEHWPICLQWLLVAAAVVTAAGVIWRKMIIPFKNGCVYAREGISSTIANHRILNEAAPLLRLSTPLLKEILKEFRTNDGSSLKDDIIEIRKQANQAATMAKVAGDSAREAAVLAKEVHEIVTHLKGRA
jgi:hypothetical protein